MTDIGVIGLGHVGASVAAGMYDLGHSVIGVDIDQNYLQSIRDGEPDIDEPAAVVLQDIELSTNLTDAEQCDVVFICTPVQNNAGTLDTSSIETVLECGNWDNTVVAVKSTISPNDVSTLRQKTEATLGVNPEFLTEGCGFRDFMHADRVVLGGSAEFIEVMSNVYASHPAKHILTDARTAALGKLASNSFLATKISFANDIGMTASDVDADSGVAMEIVQSDHRVNRSHLQPGHPWGGSCLPKDVDVLEEFSETRLLRSVQKVNDGLIRNTVRNVRLSTERAEKTTVGLVGLGFKPGSSNTEKSFATRLSDQLRKLNFQVVGYDEHVTHFNSVVLPSLDSLIEQSDVVVETSPEYSIDHEKVIRPLEKR